MIITVIVYHKFIPVFHLILIFPVRQFLVPFFFSFHLNKHLTRLTNNQEIHESVTKRHDFIISEVFFFICF